MFVHGLMRSGNTVLHYFQEWCKCCGSQVFWDVSTLGWSDCNQASRTKDKWGQRKKMWNYFVCYYKKKKKRLYCIFHLDTFFYWLTYNMSRTHKLCEFTFYYFFSFQYFTCIHRGIAIKHWWLEYENVGYRRWHLCRFPSQITSRTIPCQFVILAVHFYQNYKIKQGTTFPQETKAQK